VLRGLGASAAPAPAVAAPVPVEVPAAGVGAPAAVVEASVAVEAPVAVVEAPVAVEGPAPAVEAPPAAVEAPAAVVEAPAPERPAGDVYAVAAGTLAKMRDLPDRQLKEAIRSVPGMDPDIVDGLAHALRQMSPEALPVMVRNFPPEALRHLVSGTAVSGSAVTAIAA
jgi:ribonuclease E